MLPVFIAPLIAKLGAKVSPYVGKILMYAAIGLAVFAAYHIWENRVEDGARDKFNIEQMNLVIKNQTELKKTLGAIEKKQSEILDEQTKLKEDVARKMIPVTTYLRSEEAKKDNRPAGPVVKKTIDQLRNLE